MRHLIPSIHSPRSVGRLKLAAVATAAGLLTAWSIALPLAGAEAANSPQTAAAATTLRLVTSDGKYTQRAEPAVSRPPVRPAARTISTTPTAVKLTLDIPARPANRSPANRATEVRLTSPSQPLRGAAAPSTSAAASNILRAASTGRRQEDRPERLRPLPGRTEVASSPRELAAIASGPALQPPSTTPAGPTELRFKLSSEAAINKLRSADAGPDAGAPLRRTVEHIAEVNRLRDHDFATAWRSVRAASHEDRPSQRQATPERQAMLVTALPDSAESAVFNSEVTEPSRTPCVACPAPQATMWHPGTPVCEPATAEPERIGSLEVMDQIEELRVVSRCARLLRTNVDVQRAAAVDKAVCDVVQITPHEISVLGKQPGSTHLTVWFKDHRHRPMTLMVRVQSNPLTQQSLRDHALSKDEQLP